MEQRLVPNWERSMSRLYIVTLTLTWASLLAQMVKNPHAMRETWVRALGWKDPFICIVHHVKEAQAEIKVTGRNINNLIYAENTILMAENE